MKTSSVLAAVAGAALVAAQLEKIPTCALTCAISSIGASGCAQTDIACVCKASSFLTGILSCIEGTCTPAEIKQTLAAAQVLCAGAGVTITVPGGPSSTSSAPEPETTTAAPVPTTTEVASTTEVPTTEAVSTTEVVVPTYSATSVESTSSVVTMTTYTTICPTSTTVIPTYVPPPAQNTTVVVPPPSYTGAAGNVAANAGTVLIGAALAMFFA